MSTAPEVRPNIDETERGFQVSLPATDIAVSIARSMVRRITTFASDDAESSFMVALTEVVGNAVDEHRTIGVTAPVIMVVTYEGPEVIRIIDAGRGIRSDVETAPPSDASDESGRGLALARAFVPDMDFSVTGSGTTVTLPLAGLGIIR